MSPPLHPDPLAVALAAFVRGIVAEELSRMTGGAREYTSRSLPADASRVTFRRACAAGLVMGAERRGRVWACTREAWLEYRHAHSPRRRPVVAPPESGPVVRDGVGEVLAELGAVRVRQ